MPFPIRWACVWCGWTPDDPENGLWSADDCLYEVKKHELSCVHNPANEELEQLSRFATPTDQ